MADSGNPTTFECLAARELRVCSTAPSGLFGVVGGSKKGILDIASSDIMAINVGPTMTFSAKSDTAGLRPWTFAGIAGKKENAASENNAGYLQFLIGDDDGSLAESARLTSIRTFEMIETEDTTPTITLSGAIFISGGALWYKGFGATYTKLASA
jgi:hypothetical protein